MELRHLRYLVALAEERHFTRAAARSQVAQPALSRAIRTLEGELGVPLVDRTSRRVAMTDAGLRLVERARGILAEVDAATAEARRLVDLVEGRIAIGVTTTPGAVDVPGLLAAFHRRHPGVELAVREGLSVVLAERVRSDELDVALLTELPLAERRGLELRLLAEEELVLCVGPGHRLAGRDAVRMRELRGERFVGFPRGATIQDLVSRTAARAGFEPRIAFEASESARVCALVAEGLAVAVLPRSDAGAGVRVVRLTDRGLVHRTYLARREARVPSPAARELLAVAASA